jgi:protoheme IX farnesyltransferase
LWKTVVVLFKLRVVSLLVLASFGGAALGAMAGQSVSSWSLLLLAVVGTMAAAGASAINQYLERERDTRMSRTAARPLATGQIAQPERVLWIGVAMVITATALSAVFNLALAFWIMLGALIYVLVYTVWLKPRTTSNIVIGGAAGSCAVLSGGAAMGAWADPGVLILAALVFVWTPVHFWALALAYRDDYIKADYPMLPARVSPATAARRTAFYTVLTATCGVALGLWPQVDLLFLVPVGAASMILIMRTWQMVKKPEKWTAFKLFHFSNLYLALVLVASMLALFWR